MEANGVVGWFGVGVCVREDEWVAIPRLFGMKAGNLLELRPRRSAYCCCVTPMNRHVLDSLVGLVQDAFSVSWLMKREGLNKKARRRRRRWTYRIFLDGP